MNYYTSIAILTVNNKCNLGNTEPSVSSFHIRILVKESVGTGQSQSQTLSL